MDQHDSLLHAQPASLEINKVLKNTYMLLSMTLAFSALMAGISMMINPPSILAMGCSFAAFGIIWLVIPRTANSSKGIVAVFAFTGLLGFGLGPILNAYLQLANGSALIAQALGGTAVIFLTLSGYVITTKKDFSFLIGFLMTGFIIVIIAMIASIFLHIPGLSIAISSVVMFLMSGFILYDTSRIVRGGERNYIIATTNLYLSIYNIFISLLQILGVMNDD